MARTQNLEYRLTDAREELSELEERAGYIGRRRERPGKETRDVLTFDLLTDEGIVILEPHGPLTRDDFEQLGDEVDLFIVRHGSLRGLLIHTREFPGWQDLAGLMSHVRFVREHRDKIDRIALVSDSVMVALAPALGELFVGVEIERFDYDDRDRALAWLREGNGE